MLQIPHKNEVPCKNIPAGRTHECSGGELCVKSMHQHLHPDHRCISQLLESIKVVLPLSFLVDLYACCQVNPHVPRLLKVGHVLLCAGAKHDVNKWNSLGQTSAFGPGWVLLVPVVGWL